MNSLWLVQCQPLMKSKKFLVRKKIEFKFQNQLTASRQTQRVESYVVGNSESVGEKNIDLNRMGKFD